MKNKDKYDLRKLNWEVSRNKNSGYIVTYSTKIYCYESGCKELIAAVEGGSHMDFLDWLESETIDEEK